MSNSDRNVWSLIKELSGLDSSRSSSAPGVEDLAAHFAAKMSNGASIEDTDSSSSQSDFVVLKSLKVRFPSVLMTPKKLDPHKSANGVGPRFLTECADVLVPHLCRPFRFIVQKVVVPSGWKLGRVTAVHKRSNVSDAANYRPITCSNNVALLFEDVLGS